MIKNIHQIWVGDEPIPERFLDRSNKIKKIHYDYNHILWNEEKIIKEFPHLKVFIDLECVPAFISNISRIEILKKYGGWYIDLDYDIISDTKLENLIVFKEDLPIFLEFDRDGFWFNNGFFYSPKNHPFLYNKNLKSYLPHYPLMMEFNKAIKEIEKYYIIRKEKVGVRGRLYKEESMLSFYKHKNFNKFLKKEGELYILEHDSQLLKERNLEILDFNKNYTLTSI